MQNDRSFSGSGARSPAALTRFHRRLNGFKREIEALSSNRLRPNDLFNPAVFDPIRNHWIKGET